MELTASELWSRILESAHASLPEQSFKTWLAGTHAVGLTDRELAIEAPSDFHVEWIEDKYLPVLNELATRLLGRPLHLTVRCGSPGPPSFPAVEVSPPSTGLTQAPPFEPRAVPPKPSLNERYTFDRFVVGNNNQLAAAACNAVAERPARMYNPLFLYGGVGLGKTHLMHAIGNHLLAHSPSRRVAYVSSEQFMNELVTSIQEGKTADFRRRYRQMDLLLVDDVHFLEGKEATQEEFFHTFNALYDAQKQIILTSDRPPKDIPGLEERLVSRFEWGLVADIMPPDLETRVAILRKKAADDQLTLDDEVIDFIAHSCTASVLELEGAVIKLLAYSSLTNQEITVALARTALTGMIRPGADSPSSRFDADGVRELVARHWDVKPEALASKRRTRDLMVPRQVAMYLIRELLDVPLVRIGQVFGGRDHSTVIHSIRKVEERMQAEPEFQAEIDSLRTDITEARARSHT